jgi:ssDNA thymidine ADP-ribosyltransferase, DarT
MPVPAQPKIYHIVHVDRLASIIADKRLWSDAEMIQRQIGGTTIGMSEIKGRRLTELQLTSHPGLFVGQCTPFYFCPRSVMLYLIHRANHPNLNYRGGQCPIIHLEADLRAVVAWAQEKERRWAFTLSNAGSKYFEDRCDLDDLDDINWEAVTANWWQGAFEEGKQAEFLIERSFPWHLVERIGVHSQSIVTQVATAMQGAAHRPRIEIRREWYY